MYFVIFLSALVACSAGLPADTTDPKREGRINNGREAEPDEFPYMLSLRVNGIHKCGAVIIDKKWALTAAHCVINLNTSQMTVVAGSINRSDDKNSIEVQKSYPHEYFNNNSHSNDIALLQLKEDFKFGNSINSINIRRKEVTKRTVAIFAGWGVTDRDQIPKSIPIILRKTNLLILGKPDRRDNMLCWTKNLLCAYDEDGNGPNHGDSGGPLVDDENNLIGIDIRGDSNCTLANCLHLFTKVYAYQGWINKIMTEDKKLFLH